MYDREKSILVSPPTRPTTKENTVRVYFRHPCASPHVAHDAKRCIIEPEFLLEVSTILTPPFSEVSGMLGPLGEELSLVRGALDLFVAR